MTKKYFTDESLTAFVDNVKTYTDNEINSFPQSDWNQNDETAKDYIKNRTHWFESTFGDIVPETTVEIIDDTYAPLEGASEPLEAGVTYTVIFNGVEYNCVAWVGEDDAILIGNGSIYGGTGGNDEPFSCDSHEGGSIYLNVLEAGNYTISISRIKEIYHHINPKFIKDMYYVGDPVLSLFFASEFELNEEDGESSKTFNSTSALENGKNYTVILNGESYDLTYDYKDDILCMGNAGIIGGEDTGEPFVLVSEDTELAILFHNDMVSWGWNNIEIYTMMPEIHKIDAKFLPDNLGVGRKGTGVGAEIFNAYGEEDNVSTYAVRPEAPCNHAEGDYSHAEGRNTSAIGYGSHAEGLSTDAKEEGSHAEGINTKAIGVASHAEGRYSKAIGYCSHVEGEETFAEGENSHAEGINTKAIGVASHAEGYDTYASSNYQHVQGRHNILDADEDGNPLNKYAHIVGNGYYDEEAYEIVRSNAHTLDWDGNAWFAGDVYVGSTSGVNKDDGSKKLVTTDDINDLIGDTPVAEQISEALAGKADTNHTHTWENIQGKPFETIGGDTLTWDGNTDGRTIVDGIFVHITDIVPSLEECSNGGMYTSTSLPPTTIESGGIADIGNGCLMYLGNLAFIIIPTDNFDTGEGIYPHKGVYFVHDGTDYTTSLTINGYTGFGKEIIKEEVIPHKELKPTWENIQGKPFEFVGEDTLTWDGNTVGLVGIDALEVGIPNYWRISNIAPTYDDLVNGVSLVHSLVGSSVIQETYEYTQTNFRQLVPNVFGNEAMIIVAEDTEVEDVGFCEKGLYVLGASTDENFSYVSSLTINGYTGFGKEIIKEEVLPFIIKTADTNTFVPSKHEAAFTVDLGEGLLMPFYDLGETTAEDLLSGCVVSLYHPVSGDMIIDDADDGFSSQISEETDDYVMIGLCGLLPVIIAKRGNINVDGILISKAGIYLMDAALAQGGELRSLKLKNGTFKLAGKKIEQSYVATDWEESDKTSVSYIKNKPFGEELTYSNTLTWDGGNGDAGFYCVNDNVPDFNDFIGAEISIYNTGSNSILEKYTITEADMESSNDAYTIKDLFIVVTKRDNFSLGEYILPKKGIYITKFETAESAGGGYHYVSEIVATKDIFTTTKIKQLDAKYLPSTLSANELVLTDTVTGSLYKIQIQNGQLVSFPV